MMCHLLFAIVYHLNRQIGNEIFFAQALVKTKIMWYACIRQLEEMEAIARAIRPITYKKTFRDLEVIFVSIILAPPLYHL
jgi:hypothetical protein